MDGRATRGVGDYLAFFLRCHLEESMNDEISTGAATVEDDRGCRFCPDTIKDRIVAAFGSVWAVEDRYPVSEGHHLIVPKRHTADWFQLSAPERGDADALIHLIRQKLLASDGSITGFNVGMNCGASAGQTIFHAHIHLIPRRDGDMTDPTGGVRGVIPDRMSYTREDEPVHENRRPL